jgi:sulfide dehydrogenase cytochrome subunit
MIVGLSLSSVTFAGDIAKITELCISCHAKDGASTDKDIPIIGGQSVKYQVFSWKGFKNRERVCPETEIRYGAQKGQKTDHCKIAATLSDEDVTAVSTFFAGKPFVRASQPFDANLVAKGKTIHAAQCEKCHTKEGTVPADNAAILAGQQVGYMNNAFKEFLSEKRATDPKMKLQLDELNKDGIQALINYYASFK